MKTRTFKTAGILLAVLLLMQVFTMLVLPAETATAVTELINGDFSQGNEGWEFPAATSAKLEQDESGDQYASILVSGTQIYSPTIPVKSGEIYAWTVDFNSNIQCRGWAYYLDSEGNKHFHPNAKGDKDYRYFTSNGTWTSQMLIYTVPTFPEKEIVAMGVALNTYAFPKDTYVYFDNVDAQKLDRNSDANSIKNGNMETLQNGMPRGFTVTGDGCTVETVNRHSGNTALKITRTEPGETKVSVKVPTIYSTPAANYAFSAYMNLTEFEDDPYNENDGVSLQMTRVDKPGEHATKTGAFTKTMYKDNTPMGWRKMLGYNDIIRSTAYEVTVIFNGIGTVYIDDFYCGVDLGGIRNGDFEGFHTDYKPAGWTGDLKWGEGDDANYLVLREGNTDNHYVRFVFNGGSKCYIMQPLNMEQGLRYKASADIKSGEYDCCMYISDVTESNITTGSTPNDGKDWLRGFSLYATNVSTLARKPQIVIGDRNGNGNTETGVYACFDNLTLAIADEPDTLTFTETDEKVTAVFTGMSEDYTSEENYKKARVVIARYLVTGDIFTGIKKQLDSFMVQEGVAAMVPITSQTICKKTKLGEVPMTVTVEFEKEEAPSGHYEYKAFAVDTSNPLLPFVKAADLFK